MMKNDLQLLKTLVANRLRKSKLDPLIPTAMQAMSRQPDGPAWAWLKELDRISQANPTLARIVQEHGLPVERTLWNWNKRYYLMLDGTDRARLSDYRWPESHLNGDVPWEASEVGLSLLRLSPGDQLDLDPTVGRVRWAYWLTLSAPSMPFEFDPKWRQDPIRLGHIELFWNVRVLSQTLDMSDNIHEDSYYQWRSPQDPVTRVNFADVVRDYLLWQPWLSDGHRKAYLDGSSERRLGPVAIHYGLEQNNENIQILSNDAVGP